MAIKKLGMDHYLIYGWNKYSFLLECNEWIVKYRYHKDKSINTIRHCRRLWYGKYIWEFKLEGY
jgi:hypothetical protein